MSDRTRHLQLSSHPDACVWGGQQDLQQQVRAAVSVSTVCGQPRETIHVEPVTHLQVGQAEKATTTQLVLHEI